MNLFEPKKLDELIISLLISGECGTISLLEEVRSKRVNTTKQGFYAALRNLKKDEVILVYKARVSLNTLWIQRMYRLIESADRNYTKEQKSFDVLGLTDRESISYTFSNLKNLDIFWGHSQNILIHNTPINEPIYAYDPHYWFYLAREQTEKGLLKEVTSNKRQFLMTVGHSMALDKVIKSQFKSPLLQYNYKKLFSKENYYVTIIGDYITEVLLDEKMAVRIHEIYKNSNALNDEVLLKLQSFLSSKTKSKIKISKNIQRAEKLKRLLGRDFYIHNTYKRL